MSHDASTSIDELLERYLRKRDRDAIREVVDITRPRLRALARRIAGESQADDVVQATYLALVRRGASSERAPLWAYLITATVRIAYRHRAKCRRLWSLAEAQRLGDDAPEPMGELIRGETIELTRTAIAALPPPYRDVVVLRHLEGRSVKEVALLLDVPLHTAKTRLRRARTLLRVKAGRLGPALPALVPLAGLADLHAIVPTVGGLMKAKTLGLAAVALLAFGTGGMLLFTGNDDPPAPESHSQQLDSSPRLAAASPQPEQPSAPEEVNTKAPVAPPPEVKPERDPARDESMEGTLRENVLRGLAAYLDGLVVPEVVRKQAAALRVSDETLRSMYGAEYVLHGAVRQPGNAVYQQLAREALDELSRAGEEGFRAVVANAKGNPHNNSRVDLMAEATWQPGYEAHLLEWLGERDAMQPSAAPLRALRGVDAPGSREFLLKALEKYENNASNFYAAATALAALKEEGVAQKIAPALLRRSWAGLRPGLLEALGQLGGAQASEVLVRYLRDPKANVRHVALAALARIDPGAARSEARALLDGVRKVKLQALEEKMIEQFLRDH